MSRIVARYWIETAFPLETAAEAMAGEQSGKICAPSWMFWGARRVLIARASKLF